jgi:two-component system phosphate regulon response regulator PhoB
MAGNVGGKSSTEEKRVLIVDDDDATRLLLRAIVEGLSVPCLIYEATDGDAAIQFARRNRPDLALIDIVLPGSEASGVTVCKELCRDSRTKVVVVSGQASDAIIQAALSAGAQAYVRKPFAMDEMRARLESMLAD